MSLSSDEAFVLQVIAALEGVRLEAIIVGNVAAILQGVPVTTQDLDLLVGDTPPNRAKIDDLGGLLGARPREISPLSRTLRIDAEPAALDILFDELSGGLRFESLRSRAIPVSLGEKTALVARLEDVIASKEATNRPKDQAQLPILRDALRIKQALDRG